MAITDLSGYFVVRKASVESIKNGDLLTYFVAATAAANTVTVTTEFTEILHVFISVQGAAADATAPVWVAAAGVITIKTDGATDVISVQVIGRLASQ